MLKQTAKSLFNLMASRFGPHTKTHKEGKLWILMYHRILPEDKAKEFNEEAGMYVTPKTFKENLIWLNEFMQPVRLQDWVSKKNSTEYSSGNYYAITFDDGWQDNYQYAFPVLKELNIPATIFLVSSLMGTNNVFWPNRLAKLIPYLSNMELQSDKLNSIREKLNLKLSDDFTEISNIIATAKQYSDSDMTKWLDEIEEELSLGEGARQLLNWQEIEEMLRSGIIDVGAHTKHHIRLLETTTDSVIDDEVVGSKQEVEKKTKQKIDLFCYPNGDFSDYSAKQVSQNYKAAVTTQKGINTHQQNIYKLMRVGIHQDISQSKNDFLARLACWR